MSVSSTIYDLECGLGMIINERVKFSSFLTFSILTASGHLSKFREKKEIRVRNREETADEEMSNVEIDFYSVCT